MSGEAEVTHCANCGAEVPADKPHRVGGCTPLVPAPRPDAGMPIEHVVDRDGYVWRVVRDGGMATRAHYAGIISIGIAALERQAGPLVTLRAHDDRIRADTLAPVLALAESARAATKDTENPGAATVWLASLDAALRVAAGTPTHHTTEEDADE